MNSKRDQLAVGDHEVDGATIQRAIEEFNRLAKLNKYKDKERIKELNTRLKKSKLS